MKIGDKVWVGYDGKWYKGTVIGVFPDGRYLVKSRFHGKFVVGNAYPDICKR